MGRPLYSSVLLSRQTAVAPEQPAEQTQPSLTEAPTVEKWSQWNAFDPDSDEFFQAAVYEAFLTEQQIADLRACQTERILAGEVSENAATNGPEHADEGVETNSLRMMRRLSGLEVYFLGDPPHDGGRTVEESSEHSDAINSSVPRIAIAASSHESTERQPPPPGFSNLVSGLSHLSESPQPIQPIDPASRPVSPIPDTPARVSGIFTTSPPGFISQAPTSNATSRLRGHGYHTPHRTSRLLPGDQSALYRHPPAPSPLTS